MGYYACGDGTVTIKENVNIDKVISLLQKLNDNDIEFEKRDNYIDFWENDSHWHEENTFEFLDALTPYITEGRADYSGEDDCIWRYIFHPESETWEEENATIDYNFESYTDEELIAEIIKRGYKVSLEYGALE